ncbi:MAG TPA: hypothetical protein DD727_03945, partial [Clostridiales bacterium]|nr:hypothetical protein [Clostridiales bacterium]
RGIRRAKAAGITPAPSTAACVMGRLQDFLSKLNADRGTGLSEQDLDEAALAMTKRCIRIFKERGYATMLMPAAFRSARQVAQMAGSATMMTVHPKLQDEVIAADAAGLLERRKTIDDPADEEALDRVARALPEFTLAYAPDALKGEECDRYGGTVMTLEGFDVTGWQKLKTL